MGVILVAILAIGITGTLLVLVSPKNDEEREYEDECQLEYLRAFEQRDKRRKWHPRRKVRSQDQEGELSNG